MVVLNDVKNMFWGVTLDGGKRYSQTVEHSFHISMAAVEIKAESGGGDKKHQGNVAVMIQHDKAEFLLCTLSDKIPQTALDLNFSEGEDVTFFLNGTGVVHLTGYLLDDSAFDNDLPEDGVLMGEEEMSDEEDSDDVSDDDEDGEEDEEEPPNLLFDLDDEDSDDDEDFDPMSPSKVTKKRKNEEISSFSPAKKSKGNTMFADLEAEEDSDEEDDSSNMEDDYDSDDDLDFDEDDSDEELDSDEEMNGDDDDESDDEPPTLKEQEKTSPKSPKKAVSKVTPKSEKGKNKTGVETPNQKPTKSGKGTPATDSPKVNAKTKPEGAVQNGASPSPSKKKKKNKDGTSPVKADKQTPGKKGETPGKKGETPGKKGDTPGKKGEEKTPSKPKEGETPKSKKKQKKSEEATSPATTPGKQARKTLPGGTMFEVLSEGHGPEAKSNKMVSMYYRGTLKQNNKMFDECMKGKPFKFKLGKGEVIKGWDAAIQGMKVGGKRKITVPPSQGYGNQRVGPIPPGSTLIFEVELKAVS